MRGSCGSCGMIFSHILASTEPGTGMKLLNLHASHRHAQVERLSDLRQGWPGTCVVAVGR